MEMYSREEIAGQKNLRKRAKLAAVIISVLAAVVCVVLLITVKPLNETLFRVIASAAAAVAGCFDIYIASFVMPYMRPKPRQRKTGGKILHVLGNILRQTHMYIIWILLSAVLVSFLFNLATDTSRAKKVTVYVDAPDVASAQVETRLNADLPEGIKMTKVHTFSYHTFGMGNLGADDIYLVKEENTEQYAEGFAPLEGYYQFRSIDHYWVKDGVVYGVLMEFEGEEYYLFFGKDCVHPGKDGAAAYIAERLMERK
ncbi:MAG: hypothetical protein IJM39_02530 [Firmicutes bacterium]|nr:hypothetical protein [Bacillota bacterium]